MYQPLLEHIIVTGQQLTGKKIMPAPNDYETYQTRNTIKYEAKYQDTDTGNFLFLLHEICHFIAANHDMRKKYNLSFPLFELRNIHGPIQPKLKHALSELKTLYFTQRLYLPWIQSQTNLPQIWISFVEYLCEMNNKCELLATVQTTLIDTSIWDKQLNRKLSHLGYSIDTFQKQLHTYSYQQS